MANALEILVERVVMEMIEQQPGISTIQLTHQDSDDTASKDRIIVRATSAGATDEPSSGSNNLPSELELEIEVRIQRRSSALMNAALSAVRNAIDGHPQETPFTQSAFDYFEILPSSGDRSAERESRVSVFTAPVLARINPAIESGTEFLLQDGTPLLLQDGSVFIFP